MSWPFIFCRRILRWKAKANEVIHWYSKFTLTDHFFLLSLSVCSVQKYLLIRSSLMVTQKYSCVNEQIKSWQKLFQVNSTLLSKIPANFWFICWFPAEWLLNSNIQGFWWRVYTRERETERACSKLSLQGKLSYLKLLTHSSLDDSAFEGHSLICFIPVFYSVCMVCTHYNQILKNCTGFPRNSR